MFRPYDHLVHREVVYEGRRECLRCGHPTIGAGRALRHVGEEIRPALPPAADLAAYRHAVQLAATAHDGLLTGYATGEAYAHAVIGAVYAEGGLVPRLDRWKRPAPAAA